MSFSWSVTDCNEKDLLAEFDVNGQALGLADDNTPHSISDVRECFYRVPYKDKLIEASQDAINFTQALVLENLNYYTAPAHPDCPSCKCERAKPRIPFGFDIEQARRFISIPLTRVHRASGGW